ncbi:hypothetical protein HW452_03040 [Halomonas aquamarina]|uniref:Uncharacterized protein n=1 Tax=Vreelandella aquamarina TaxID=77097 RepID=A0ACC5VS62_9GAMM|nr:hypothetical protein [Halomonas aquamarina]MBZ5486492.1 hypothetical protein [Halomonas aquamarina]
MDIEFIQWVVSGGVGGAIISFALKIWFETRIKNSIKLEYDTRLLELKNELEKESSALSVIQNHYRATNSVGHEKVLESLEALWIGMVNIKKNMPPVLSFIDVLLEKDFGKKLGCHEHKNFADITDADIMKMFSGELENVKQYRLFSGELIYSYFASYQRLVARISLVIKTGREDKDVPLWWKDGICRSVIFSVCSKEEVVEFDKLEYQRMGWLLNLIEQKFLFNANQIISGEVSIDNAFEQSNRIMQKYNSEPLK